MLLRTKQIIDVSERSARNSATSVPKLGTTQPCERARLTNYAPQERLDNVADALEVRIFGQVYCFDALVSCFLAIGVAVQLVVDRQVHVVQAQDHEVVIHSAVQRNVTPGSDDMERTLYLLLMTKGVLPFALDCWALPIRQASRKA